MKALTICQPYASLIIGWDGMPEEIRKRVENRTWHYSYRGPLLIHAGKSKAWLDSWWGETPDDMPFGAIIGRVDVVGCVAKDRLGFRRTVLERYPWLRDHVHAEGPYCIVLENPVRFETPIPYRGQQGLFEVPDEVVIDRWLMRTNRG
jgi:hypothetical protein